jgi:hypothetical protein
VDGGSTAVSGLCEIGKTCNKHYFFLGFIGVMYVVNFTTAKPVMNAVELSVEKENLTLAFGIYVWCYRLFGSLPSPKIFGKQFIDCPKLQVFSSRSD